MRKYVLRGGPWLYFLQSVNFLERRSEYSHRLRWGSFRIVIREKMKDKLELTEQDLLTHETPIIKIIEDNSVASIQSIVDRQFLTSL
tara:strand:- start:1000 stop:1260 length:261 start_codon:yes stop_codon:yes gene_type:complete